MVTKDTKRESKQIAARVILARDSFPYLGGSSTILYLLFQYLLPKLPNAECWNIVTPHMWKMGRRYFGPHWSNPKGLPNVRTFIMDGTKGERAVRNALRERPVEAILSKSRRTTPIPVWHLTSTCSVIKNAITANRFRSMEHAVRQLRSEQFSVLRSPEELQAVRSADRILFHTKSMRFWYYTFYPQYREKMAEDIFWDFPLLKRQFRHVNETPWEKRPIDLLFVASDWKRGEKNFSLMKKLCQVFKGRKIMVIGFLPEPLPEWVIAFDSMSQEDVVQAMVQAKVLVSPSKYDEAPNVLFEAGIAGANLVCSENCGNYQLAPKAFVARLGLRDFTAKIRKALHGYQQPATDMFAKHDLRDWIVDEVTARNGTYVGTH